MTTPSPNDSVPGYLPPDVADMLRAILAGNADPAHRGAIIRAAEEAFRLGNAFGYDRGYADGREETDAVYRQHYGATASRPYIHLTTDTTTTPTTNGATGTADAFTPLGFGPRPALD